MVGDHSVELGPFWACPGPQAQLFLRNVGVHPQKSQHRHCWGTADRPWASGMGWTRCNSTLVLSLQCDENSTFNNHALYLGLPCCKEDYNGCPNIPSSLIFQRSTKETFSVSTQLSSTKLTQNGELLIPQNCPRQQELGKRENKFPVSTSTQSRVCFAWLLQSDSVNKIFFTAMSLKYQQTGVDCPQYSVKSHREKCNLYSFQSPLPFLHSFLH